MTEFSLCPKSPVSYGDAERGLISSSALATIHEMTEDLSSLLRNTFQKAVGGDLPNFKQVDVHIQLSMIARKSRQGRRSNCFA